MKKNLFLLVSIALFLLSGQPAAAMKRKRTQQDIGAPKTKKPKVTLNTTLNVPLHVGWSIFKNGYSVTSRDDNGATPLHHAARNGQILSAKMILKAGKEQGRIPTSVLIEQDNDGNTAEHYAVKHGQIEFVKYLRSIMSLSAIMKNKFGETPGHYAIKHGQTKIAKLLIPSAEAPRSDREEGFMYYASKYGNIEIAEFLLEKGYSLNTKSNKRQTKFVDHFTFNS